MNFVKSLFISSYLTVATAIAAYGVWRLYQGDNSIAWAGVILTTGPILLIIGRLMMFKNMARTSAHFPLLTGLAAIGTIMAVREGFDHAVAQTAPVLAVIGLAGILIYIYWYSNLDRRSGAKIRIGDPLPDFIVMDINDAAVTARQLTDRPAILIFYRGNWCPLCMAQIKEMVALYDDIRRLGVRVALISPQPHKNTMALARKFAVGFDFLTDRDNQAARTLGLENPNGLPLGMQMLGYDSETVLPTVIITDREGRVIWSHETDNYRVRPEPATYLDVLRHNGIIATRG